MGVVPQDTPVVFAFQNYVRAVCRLGGLQGGSAKRFETPSCRGSRLGLARGGLPPTRACPCGRRVKGDSESTTAASFTRKRPACAPEAVVRAVGAEPTQAVKPY